MFAVRHVWPLLLLLCPSQLQSHGLEHICDTKHSTITPRSATKDNKFVRTFTTVTCMGNQNQGLRESCGGGMFGGRKTECVQEFSEYKLVALGSELVVERFSFPSGCSCMMSGGYISRGLGPVSSPQPPDTRSSCSGHPSKRNVLALCLLLCVASQ